MKNRASEALHSATRMGNYSEVKKLINEGADIGYLDEFNSDAVYYAVVHYRSEILKLLLESGGDINRKYKEKQNILHIAVNAECEDRGGFEVIKTLVEAGVEINCQDKYGNTPLWYACIYYAINQRTIRYLLEEGADMNIVNQYGLSAYTASKQNQRDELADILDKYRNAEMP
jgi:ankyrin repeat protein